VLVPLFPYAIEPLVELGQLEQAAALAIRGRAIVLSDLDIEPPRGLR
jgi:hypothetical protein